MSPVRHLGQGPCRAAEGAVLETAGLGLEYRALAQEGGRGCLKELLGRVRPKSPRPYVPWLAGLLSSSLAGKVTCKGQRSKGPASPAGMCRALPRPTTSSADHAGSSVDHTPASPLPEKFSSALQPGTLLDLLQIEGMKIEEESEVR